MRDAVTIYKYKQNDVLKVSKRKVFHAFVIGYHNSVRVQLLITNLYSLVQVT